MFVFNPDLILHNIDNWPHGLLIFGMALVGMSAFENFAQGWCLTKNRLYEVPLFLAASFILFHPGGLASLLNMDQAYRYWLFPTGLLIYGAVILLQKLRMKKG
jgi:TRAP-type uncharacterized transport system fused permease subunit